MLMFGLQLNQCHLKICSMTNTVYPLLQSDYFSQRRHIPPLPSPHYTTHTIKTAITCTDMYTAYSYKFYLFFQINLFRPSLQVLPVLLMA